MLHKQQAVPAIKEGPTTKSASTPRLNAEPNTPANLQICSIVNMDVDMDLDLTVDAPEEQYNDAPFEVRAADDDALQETNSQ